MAGFFSILLLAAIGIGSFVMVSQAALLLGAPSHWFPASLFPFCLRCKHRPLKCIFGVRDTHQEPSFYRCENCGARWLIRDQSWHDASGSQYDDVYKVELG
jgi:DNA-directed RNA polymerase subunit RPC12/RpoP